MGLCCGARLCKCVLLRPLKLGLFLKTVYRRTAYGCYGYFRGIACLSADAAHTQRHSDCNFTALIGFPWRQPPVTHAIEPRTSHKHRQSGLRVIFLVLWASLHSRLWVRVRCASCTPHRLDTCSQAPYQSQPLLTFCALSPTNCFLHFDAFALPAT